MAFRLAPSLLQRQHESNQASLRDGKRKSSFRTTLQAVAVPRAATAAAEAREHCLLAELHCHCLPVPLRGGISMPLRGLEDAAGRR